jgi:putative tryptophan/tyrosine transport system substrate-binding protein
MKAAPVQRREFITLLGGAAAAWPIAARAQQPVALPVVGVLYGVSAADWTAEMAGFRRGLAEAAFVDGRNVALVERWAEGQYNRLPAMAAELVGRKVAVILAGGSALSVRAAMAATRTIPIVFTTNNDPVANGFVASLNRPGGNVTGVTFIGRELEPKRLELLHEMIPAVSKFALLVNPNAPANTQSYVQNVQTAASRLGLEMIVVNGGSEGQIESAFMTSVQQRASALYVSGDPYVQSRRAQIAALGLRHAMPTSFPSRDSTTAGALMNYGASIPDSYRQAGVYTGRILKGEKPADLPVTQPTRFELVINLKTAKTIGLTISESFLVRADEVIE